MPDLLEVTSARMVVRDTDGTNVFDTDERPFVPFARINGSISFAERSATSNSSGPTSVIDTSVDTLIGTCPAVCNVVRGAFFVSASTAQGVANVGYFNASGSYIHWLAEGATAVAYTFYTSGGGVYINERVVLLAQTPSSGTRTAVLYASTFTYRLIAGVL